MHLKEKICKLNTLFQATKLILFAIEVDGLGHNDRNIDYEKERQKIVEKELGCEFIEINLD